MGTRLETSLKTTPDKRCRAASVAIGITTYPAPYLEGLRKEGKLMGTTAEINCVEDIFKLFGDRVEQVYFRHDRSDPAKQGPCLVIFSVRKLS